MFVNLSEKEKEEKFTELINYAEKIKNASLKSVCISILNDYKEELFVRAAGHDGIENIKYDRTHQCFDGGLLDHVLNVTKNAYNIGKVYSENVDMDLILFGAILHDIGKIKIFDKYNEENDIKSNLNYSYLLVDHVYLGEISIAATPKDSIYCLKILEAIKDSANKGVSVSFEKETNLYFKN